jgi:DNA-binding transcriptional ArsR family regulator
MSTYEQLPEKNRILRSSAEIKTYVHPVRMRILRELGDAELTLSMVAERLATYPAALSRHFTRLKEQGLIIHTRTESSGRNAQKFYRAAALRFTVEQEGEASDKVATALGILRESLSDAIGEGGESATAYLLSLRLSAKRKAELETKLARLAQEFGEAQDKDGECLTLSLALYPGQDGASGSVVI